MMLPKLTRELYASLSVGLLAMFVAHMAWRNTNVRRAREGQLPKRPPDYFKLFAVVFVATYVLMFVFAKTGGSGVQKGGGLAPDAPPTMDQIMDYIQQGDADF